MNNIFLEGLPSTEKEIKSKLLDDDKSSMGNNNINDYFAVDKEDSEKIEKDQLHLYPSIGDALRAEAHSPGERFRVYQITNFDPSKITHESDDLSQLTRRVLYSSPANLHQINFIQTYNVLSENGYIYQDLNHHLNEAYDWSYIEADQNGQFKSIEKYESVVEHAVFSMKYRYPVFIILQHTGTMLSKIVKFFTNSAFSHVAVSFSPTLNPHYSFGMRTANARSTRDAGFSTLNTTSEFYKKYHAKYEVYVMYVSKRVHDDIKIAMDDFIKKKNFWEYDFSNLIWTYFGISSDNSPRYFCTKFVSKIININNLINNKPASLWLPEDFRSIETTSLIAAGDDFGKYDPRVALINMEKIKYRDYGSIKTQYSKREIEVLLPNVNKRIDEAFLSETTEIDESEPKLSLQELLDKTSPNRIFLSSDWHLFKNNYKQAHNEINPYLTIKWAKENIKPDDVFIYLGDISYRWASTEDQEKSKKIMASLPGHKILVLGNHDKFLGSQYLKDCGFDYVVDDIRYKNILFSHRPEKIDYLPGIDLNIHGHIHNNESYWTTDGKDNINVYPGLHKNICPSLQYLLDNKETLTRSHSWIPNNGLHGESFVIGNLPLPNIYKEDVQITPLEPKPKPIVYFSKDITIENVLKCVDKFKTFLTGKLAIKLHFGERGNQNVLDPKLLSSVVSLYNGTFVDCNTAYDGSRTQTRDHIETAKEHGFGYAPLEILDSADTIDLKNIFADKIREELSQIKSGQIKPYEAHARDGKHLDNISVGQKIKNFDSCLAYSHFKGHPMGGYGGAIKNIGIGFASSRGKKQIHDDWESGALFLERMVESTGVIQSYFDSKIVYINVLANISMSCDCDKDAPPPVIDDIGIMVSTDPIAIDQACLDMIRYDPKAKDLIEHIGQLAGYHQVEYGEWLGIGSRDYDLRDLDTGELVSPEMVMSNRMPQTITVPENPTPSEPVTNEPVQDISDQNESSLHENMIFSNKDFLYRVNEFNSGKLNKALILGFSGSGKTTLGMKSLNTFKDCISLELDWLIHWHSLPEKEWERMGTVLYNILLSIVQVRKFNSLKEYSDKMSELKLTNREEYEHQQCVNLQVCIESINTLSKKYKDKKFILNGIWPLVYRLDPKMFDDWAVIIKGTSYIKSTWRAARRDSDNLLGAIGLFFAMNQANELQTYGTGINKYMGIYIKHFSLKKNMYQVRFEAYAFSEDTKRADLPTNVFGIPEDRKFPLDSEKHVKSAIKLFGHASEDKKKALAKRILAKARKYNINVLDTTQVYKYAHEGFLVFAENGMGVLNLDNIKTWQVSADRSLRKLDRPMRSLNLAVKEFSQRYSNDMAYVYTSNQNIPILLGQIYLSEGSYDWLIEYPLKFSPLKELTSVAEYMGMAGVNPIIGTGKTFLVDTSLDNKPLLVTDPSSPNGLAEIDNKLEIVDISNAPVYEAYEYVGPLANLERVNYLYQIRGEVNSVYEALTGKVLYSMDELACNPLFRKIDYDVLESKITNELSSLYEAVNGIYSEEPVQWVDTTCLYYENQLINKYNSLNDLIIMENPDGLYIKSRLTNKSTEIVPSIESVSESMIISIL